MAKALATFSSLLAIVSTLFALWLFSEVRYYQSYIDRIVTNQNSAISAAKTDLQQRIDSQGGRIYVAEKEIKLLKAEVFPMKITGAGHIEYNEQYDVYQFIEQ